MVDVALRYKFYSLMLLAFGLGSQMQNPAHCAELDGFAINTQDKSVTVTLFTDERASYTTEHHGKQFTIVLPNTQLSKEQLNNGLPVVIDNKNRFIGRAVPSDDGKVKIILPNLPASEYSVSIQQKRPGQPTVAPTPSVEKLKPRPAVQAKPESQFEQVAASFPKPAPQKESTTQTSRMKLSPAPARVNRGGIWNPYVYRPADFQKTASKKPARQAVQPAHSDEPVNTVSVAESVSQAFEDSNAAGSPGNDPLWYLHSLPPGSAAQTDALQGPAASIVPAQAANSGMQEPKAAPSEIKELTSEVRKGFKSLPQWLIITVAIFLGGMGLFCLIGGLVLLKILLGQSRQVFDNSSTQNGMPYMAGVVPLYTAPEAMTATQNAKSGYTSRPSYGQTSLRFEDKASIQAMDYLKGSSASVAQAIYNTSLVKFPASRKGRVMGSGRQKAGKL